MSVPGEVTRDADDPWDDATPVDDAASTDRGSAITVYWRPGCAFCSSLRRGLRRSQVATVERNIWDEPDAATFVRDHAAGNETVPTVDVAGTVLVNPSVRQVLTTAQALGLDVPEPPPRWWQRRPRHQPPTDDG